MNYPVIDTNLRFFNVSLDDEQRAVNLNPADDDPHISTQHIKSLNFKDAYAMRYKGDTKLLDENNMELPKERIKQMQDSSLSTLPKLAALVITMVAISPWLLTRLVEYTGEIVRNIPVRM